jgi:hypothetical protein
MSPRNSGLFPLGPKGSRPEKESGGTKLFPMGGRKSEPKRADEEFKREILLYRMIVHIYRQKKEELARLRTASKRRSSDFVRLCKNEIGMLKKEETEVEKGVKERGMMYRNFIKSINQDEQTSRRVVALINEIKKGAKNMEKETEAIIKNLQEQIKLAETPMLFDPVLNKIGEKLAEEGRILREEFGILKEEGTRISEEAKEEAQAGEEKKQESGGLSQEIVEKIQALLKLPETKIYVFSNSSDYKNKPGFVMLMPEFNQKENDLMIGPSGPLDGYYKSQEFRLRIGNYMGTHDDYYAFIYGASGDPRGRNGYTGVVVLYPSKYSLHVKLWAKNFRRELIWTTGAYSTHRLRCLSGSIKASLDQHANENLKIEWGL